MRSKGQQRFRYFPSRIWDDLQVVWPSGAGLGASCPSACAKRHRFTTMP